MIKIYSVLILNEKTLNSFKEFSYLFTDIIEQGEAAVCRWNEAGRDLETALPDLMDLVDTKEAWRAIIVITESDTGEIFKNADEQNPFDFSGSRRGMPFDMKESGNPLIRITQILGGVPVPEITFKSEEIREPNKEPRVVYKPVADRELESAYRALSRKYAYNGKTPEEIVIVSLRDKPERTKDPIIRVWKKSEEIDSSEFWKSNGYPSICRFIVFDVEENGKTEQYSGLFRFWISILLVTINRIASSSLQAYRLYAMRVEFNKDKMKAYFRRVGCRLKGAGKYIGSVLEKGELERIRAEEEPPDYSVVIPVGVAKETGAGLTVDWRRFPLLQDNLNQEYIKWKDREDHANSQLKKSYHDAERKLDASAAHSHQAGDFPKSEVYPLSDYQEEDLDESLDLLEDEILAMQKELPENKNVTQAKIDRAADKVRHWIRIRLSRRNVFIIFGIAAVLVILAGIPGVIYKLNNNIKGVTGILFCFALMMAAYLLAGLIAVILQKLHFNRLIEAFNQMVMESVNTLRSNAQVFGSYLGKITSRTRGAAFLKHMRNDTVKEKYDAAMLNRYLKEIDHAMEKIRHWSLVNYLDINFDAEYYEEVVTELNIAPSHLIAWLMKTSELSSAYFNHTGETIQSPFHFINRLEIAREEIYNNE